MLAPVALFDHLIVPSAQPVAVNGTVSLPHTCPDPEITGAAGAGLVPIVMLLDTGDTPHDVEHVAVYVPAPTCTLAPVPALLDHVIVPPVQPVAVSVTLSVPHTWPDPEITGADGAGRLVTTTFAELALLPHSFSQ
jgi:hypothetical protein